MLREGAWLTILVIYVGEKKIFRKWVVTHNLWVTEGVSALNVRPDARLAYRPEITVESTSVAKGQVKWMGARIEWLRLQRKLLLCLRCLSQPDLQMIAMSLSFSCPPKQLRQGCCAEDDGRCLF